MAWLAWSISEDKERPASERKAWSAYSTDVMHACVAANPNNAEAWAARGEYQTKTGHKYAALTPMRRAVELGGGIQAEKKYGHQLVACFLTVPALYYWNHEKLLHGDAIGIGSGLRKAQRQAQPQWLVMMATLGLLGCVFAYERRTHLVSRSHRGTRQTIRLAN